MRLPQIRGSAPPAGPCTPLMTPKKGGVNNEYMESGCAPWNAEATRVFLEICVKKIEVQNLQYSFLNQMGYMNLGLKLAQRTSQEYMKKQLKNKWESLKCEFAAWKSLLHYASSLGLDSEMGTIKPDDAC